MALTVSYPFSDFADRDRLRGAAQALCRSALRVCLRFSHHHSVEDHRGAGPFPAVTWLRSCLSPLSHPSSISSSSEGVTKCSPPRSGGVGGKGAAPPPRGLGIYRDDLEFCMGDTCSPPFSPTCVFTQSCISVWIGEGYLSILGVIIQYHVTYSVTLVWLRPLRALSVGSCVPLTR